MMTRVAITEANNTQIKIGDGTSCGVIGSGRVVAGDVAWEMGGYVFCPGRPASRPPIVWQDSGEMVVAYADGTYDVRDSKAFVVKTSGTLSYWPKMLIATATEEAKTWFAYNKDGDFAVLVALGLTDTNKKKYSTYIGVNLLTGDEIFRINGPYHGNGTGFSVKVVDEETIEWAGVWIDLDDQAICTRRYTNGQYEEAAGTSEELKVPEEGDVLETSMGLLNDSTVINNSICCRGAEDSGEKFKMIYPDNENAHDNVTPTCTTRNANAVSTIGEPVLSDIPAQLEKIIAGNPLSGELLLGAVVGKKVTKDINTTVYGGIVALRFGENPEYDYEFEVNVQNAVAAAMNQTNQLVYFGDECAWLSTQDCGLPIQGPDTTEVQYDDIGPFVSVVSDQLPEPSAIEGKLIAKREPYPSVPPLTVWCYANLYEKSVDGLEWILQGKTLAGALDRTAGSTSLPIPQSKIPWREGIPIGVRPRVRYTSSDYRTNSLYQHIINGSVQYEATAQAAISGKCSIGDLTIESGVYRSGFKAKPKYYISGFNTWGEAHIIVPEVQLFSYSVNAVYSFGGILHDFSLLSEAPGEGSSCDPACEEVIFQGEASGEDSSIELPYQTDNSALFVCISKLYPEGVLTVNGTDLEEKFDKKKAYAVGDLREGPVVLVGDDLYMPDENGALQKGPQTEKAALTGTTINVQLPRLAKKIEPGLLGELQEE